MRRVLAVMLPLLVAGCAWIERSSVPASPVLGAEGNGASGHPALSQTGTFVAFDSMATNLVAGDTNVALDVFVRAHANGITERVSVADDETQANGESRFPAISDDGRFVAFETEATNLIVGDGDGKTDVVVRDRYLGTTTEVGIQPNGDPFTEQAVNPAISGNGRFVSFNAYVPFQEFCCVLTGPYVRDLVDSTTTLMPSAGGGLALGEPAPLSDDGTRIVYGQFAPIPNGSGDASYSIVVADTASATVVAHVASGTLSHQAQTRFSLALSGDGHLVAVLYGSTSGGPLFIDDLTAPGLREIVSDLAATREVAVSDKGKVIAFHALVAGVDGWYITDPAGTTPKRMSADAEGGAAADVDAADLSGNGRWVAFATSDPDLVPGDTNGTNDVFTRSVRPSQTGPPASGSGS